MILMKPLESFRKVLNMETGILEPVGRVTRRHISDMPHMYADTEAVSQILGEEGDRLIYEVHTIDLPEEEGLVLYGTTIIHPGRVGEEFHMTKGHFHAKRKHGEVYLGLAGEGYLVLQTRDGVVRDLPMQPGTVGYVPPMWAHRTVNIGDEPLIFFAAWPGDAGHDYGAIERMGFAKLLVDRNGKAIFIDNPKFNKTQ